LRLVVFAKMLENFFGMTVSVDGKGLPNKIAEISKLVKNLDLPELLRTVANRHEGSMPIRIDPSLPEASVTVQ
jgi:hypothetical protein